MGPQSPLSEGEIASGAEEKAISTKQDRARSSRVNQSDRRPPSSSRASHLSGAAQWRRGHSRDRSRSQSPYRRYRSDRSSVSSRSSSRSEQESRGSKKRRHHGNHYDRGSSDPRRHKVYIEDEDRSSGGYHSHRTDERYNRPRTPRSPSPFRHSKSKDHGREGQSHRPNSSNRDHQRNDRRSGQHRDSQRGTERKMHDNVQQGYRGAEVPGQRDGESRGQSREDEQGWGSGREHVKGSRDEHGGGNGAAFASGESSGPSSHTALGDQDLTNGTITNDVHDASGDHPNNIDNMDTESEPPVKRTAAELEDEEIAERRKRRKAILAKHKSEKAMLVQALEHNAAIASSTPLHNDTDPSSNQPSPQSQGLSPSLSTRDNSPASDSPAALEVENDMELVNPHQNNSALNEDAGPAAADYDPTMDMQEDRIKRKRDDVGDSKEQHPKPEETQPKTIKEFDMFADDDDDDDDMFAATDKPSKEDSIIKEAKTLDVNLLDNWDYPDGHYRIILGELMDGRYAVREQVGKGTYATVVRAQDKHTDKPVAIKIACNNDTMYKAAQKEMDMLTLLNQEDSDDKRHVIRLERSFMHKSHLCLVFENLSADLRDILKKFGRNTGINLKAIRSYAQQIFLALNHLKKCEVLHADIKPDNILVSDKRSMLKVCDLGTATFITDAEITPYLVSRFYRAPEVILGLKLDYAIDMWSVGCTLFELYSGGILFTGGSNNQMLRAIQECRGKIPMRVLKKSEYGGYHYSTEGVFFSQEPDRLSGKVIARPMHFTKTEMAGKDIKTRLNANTHGMNQVELKEHVEFVDLLDKCLQLDPAKRITPSDALRHPFVIHPKPMQAKVKTGGAAMMAPPRVK